MTHAAFALLVSFSQKVLSGLYKLPGQETLNSSIRMLLRDFSKQGVNQLEEAL